MNNVNIIGRITNDLEVRTVGQDLQVLSFSIAYNERRRDREESHFFDVTAWGKQAETIATYFKKGQRIGITGRLRQERFKDREGNNRSKVSLVLSEFVFIEPKEGGTSQGRGQTANQASSSPTSSQNSDYGGFKDISALDDEVPF